MPAAPVFPPAPRRGRPPTVSLERIVATAAEMPLDGLTLAAVAAQLSVSDTAIRQHAGSATRLYRLAADRVFAGFETTSVASDWPGYLTDLAARLTVLRRDHPGIEAYVRSGPYEPAALAVFDAIIAQLRARASITEETAYMLGVGVTVAVLSDPALAAGALPEDAEARARVATVSRWRLECLIEGMRTRVERGDVPQVPPVSQSPAFVAPPA